MISLFLIANIFFLVATILLIKTVIKNRKILKGYDLTGSFLTLLGMMFATIALYLLGDLFSVMCSMFTTLYWGFVTAYQFCLE